MSEIGEHPALRLHCSSPCSPLLPASAQKAGGILKMYTVDIPASMSILEEATVF